MGKFENIKAKPLMAAGVIVVLAYVGYQHPIDATADGAMVRAAVYAGMSLMLGYLAAKACR